jgi:hypothetical protein
VSIARGLVRFRPRDADERAGRRQAPLRRVDAQANREPPSAPPNGTTATSAPEADGRSQWNVWVLDRLTRDGAGIDASRDEERALLLLHLREFAGPDGMLPVSFDELVRETFGDLIAAGDAT